MTAYDVDTDLLESVLAEMTACGSALADLAAEVDVAHEQAHTDWVGLAGDAHAAAHEGWRSAFAEMSTALAGLGSVGETARDNYRAAVTANVAMWEQLH